MELEIIASLIPLAKRGALDDKIYLNSNEFAKDLKTSQQTANRRLQILEKMEYITRTGSSRRQQIQLTDVGKMKVKELFFDLYNIFSEQEHEVTIRGRLISGMGEGKYYISRPGYRNQFINKMGFSPYPGTFNIILDDKNLARFQGGISKLLFITLEEFRTEDRTFGAVKTYKATINNKVDGAIIMPYRTHHDKNIIEIVAPNFLRKELGTKEGDIIDVTMYG
ncbi:MAG: DUF120 domain-containing protein [Candidatus Methanofastidiosia archaeon]